MTRLERHRRRSVEAAVANEPEQGHAELTRQMHGQGRWCAGAGEHGDSYARVDPRAGHKTNKYTDG
jgi:hypothetical protein